MADFRNAMNADDVVKAMDGQEILLCSLEGDVLTMAKNIVAADTIAASKAVTTLLRCPGIKN